MPLPTKLYENYGPLQPVLPTVNGFVFRTRDPAAEMEYTAKIFNELFDSTGYWAGAEIKAGGVLTNRFLATEGQMYLALSQRLGTIRNDFNTFIGATTADTAYTQYLAGMSAAFGGGHVAVTALTNITSQDRRMQILELAVKQLQGTGGTTHQATSAMPLLVPVESQLVADASAGALESYALGEIRNQQVRQSKAAGAHMSAVAPAQGNNPTPSDEVVMFASIRAAGLAANTD